MNDLKYRIGTTGTKSIICLTDLAIFFFRIISIKESCGEASK